MLKGLKKLLGIPGGQQAQVSQRDKQFLTESPDILYAIGDIHGCLRQFTAIEDMIAQDAETEDGSKLIVTLGDYVDRGPDSAGVLDILTNRPQHRLPALHLAGNHEDVMLDFLRDPDPDHEWLTFGGLQTLQSYGIYNLPSRRRDLANLVRAHVPDDHMLFLETLPSLIKIGNTCLVHAGIDPEKDLKDQKDSVLLWKRPIVGESWAGFRLVHGHTPVPAVDIHPFRINVDTGSYATGVLSAVKLKKSGEVSVISAN